MSPVNPTFSQLERAIACPASCVLPHTERDTDASKRGTAIHAFLGRCLMRPEERDDALAECPSDARGTCGRIDLDGVRAGLTQIATEVAFAIDVHTGRTRMIGSHIGRQYGELSATEIAGSIDLVGWRDDVPVVIDFKTGLRGTPVADHWQMRAAALAIVLRTSAAYVEARLCYIAEDGALSWDTHTWDAFDLLAFVPDLQRLIARIGEESLGLSMGETPRTHVGAHCGYCPAFDHCPANLALARRMTAELDDIETRFDQMTPNEQGLAWLRAQQIRQILDRVIDALKSRARAHSLPLPNGKRLALVESVRSSFDSKRALELLGSLGATSDQIAGCYREATVAQVRELKRTGTE